MARTVKEWRGRTDDAMPAAPVRTRILIRDDHTCHICKGKIDPGQKWIPDHVPPLIDGGENRESMIKPAHKKCHDLLTAQQAVERAPVKRKQQKHLGAKPPPKKPMQGRGFAKSDKPKKDTITLPRRNLYEAAQ